MIITFRQPFRLFDILKKHLELYSVRKKSAIKGNVLGCLMKQKKYIFFMLYNLIMSAVHFKLLQGSGCF